MTNGGVDEMPDDAEPVARTGSGGGRRSIAIVDDRPVVRDVVASLLGDLDGIEVTAPVNDDPGTLADLASDVLLVGRHSTVSPSSTRVRWMSEDQSVEDIVHSVTGHSAPSCERSSSTDTHPLTNREREVMHGLERGLDTHAIADLMGIARKSVENHRQHIYAKLGVHSQVEAVMSMARLDGGLAAGGRVRTAVILGASTLLGSAIATVLRTRLRLDTRMKDSLDSIVEECKTATPDLVVSTPRLSDGPLTDVIPDLLRLGIRILILSGPTVDNEIADLLMAGASGCLPASDLTLDKIATAVHNVLEGHASLHPAIAAMILQQWRSARDTDVGRDDLRSNDSTMTSREMDVLEVLARGLPTKSIARELGVSPKTVEAHTSKLYSKLGARTRTQAVSIALSRGLLPRSG